MERDDILRQFVRWLDSEGTDSLSPLVNEYQAETVGLIPLHEALVAQRHEFKLLVKSNRKTEELLGQYIQETAQIVEKAAQIKLDKVDIERKSVTPFLKSLIELDEAIRRTADAVSHTEHQLQVVAESAFSEHTKSYIKGMSFWSWFWHRKIVVTFAEAFLQKRASEVNTVFAPFRQGFEMARRRLEDIFRRHAITRLNPLGDMVNPETMQVVATVETDAVLAGHVTAVMRCGYLWKGHPIRFADVQAAVTPLDLNKQSDVVE